jgi:DNA polymerase-3 subunit chi
VAKVDFHSQVKDKVHYACRLIRKVISLSSENEPFQTIVVLGSQEVLQDLNERLWTFSADDFLPHAFLDDDAFELCPIILADLSDENRIDQLPHQDVLIHLGQNSLDRIEAFTHRFKRVVEVVSMENTDLLAGRERYKKYRELGLELQNFDQKGA